MCRLSPPSFAYRDTQSLQINQLKLFKSSRNRNFTCANLLSVRSHKKPDGWSLLGDNKVQMARETLFHFCARLGLVKFIRLLFSKVRDFQRSIYSKKSMFVEDSLFSDRNLLKFFPEKSVSFLHRAVSFHSSVDKMSDDL